MFTFKQSDLVSLMSLHHVIFAFNKVIWLLHYFILDVIISRDVRLTCSNRKIFYPIFLLNMAKNQKPQKKYECEYCRKMFSTRSARNNHENTHKEYRSSESSLISVDSVQDLPVEDKSEEFMCLDSHLEHFSEANEQGERAQDTDRETPNNHEPEQGESRQKIEEDTDLGQEKNLQEMEEDTDSGWEENSQEMEEDTPDPQEMEIQEESAQSAQDNDYDDNNGKANDYDYDNNGSNSSDSGNDSGNDTGNDSDNSDNDYDDGNGNNDDNNEQYNQVFT
jgi:hypothetical protein